MRRSCGTDTLSRFFETWEGGRVARRLGVLHAGHVVVLDGDATARYTGAIDSDRFRLHPDAIPYVANALADLLSGRAPERAATESVGCALDP